MNATAIIQVYYREREPNLLPILRSIFQVQAIERVIIWQNNVEYRQPPELWRDLCALNRQIPIDGIVSSFDTLIGQYAAAFLASTSLIYCQNDDLILTPASITAMLTRASACTQMIGIQGRILDRHAAMPYGAGKGVASGPADVLIGRAWAAVKRALIAPMTRCLAENLNPDRGEDMFFSWQNAEVLANLEWSDIPENRIGLCHEHGHHEERERWARYLVALGDVYESTTIR